MKKIFVASPVRGGVSPEYVRSLITLLFSKMQYHKTANPDGPIAFDWGATSGTSVAMARDELVHVCVSRGFDGILWHDIDLGAFNSQTTLSMYARLLSHIDRVDVVAGQYVGHNFLSQFHGATVKDSTGPDEYGLLEMEQVPLGFSYVSTKAFLQVMKAHPERQYMIKETCMKEEKRGMFEFHPNGIAGPCSAHGKLARIKEALKDYKTHAANFSEYLEEIHKILDDDRYETNALIGEDFYFCLLARQAGVKLYVDNNLIIPHKSDIRLPVPNSDIMKALAEEWRWGDKVVASEVHHLIAGLKERFAPDHI